MEEQNDELEIDLLQLFNELKRFWIAIVAVALIGGLVTYAYSRFYVVPIYKSTATMYILTKETTLTSLADLQIGSQLTNDYRVVVISRTVLEKTVDELGLDYNYKVLKGKIDIENPQNSRILEITASDPNPYMAKKIADCVSKNASDYIADTMEITPPKIIETGEIPDNPSSPDVKKNTLIGTVVAALLIMGIIVVRKILNDAVTNADDVERYLHIPVLGSIPDRSKTAKKKKKKIRK